MTAGRKLRVLGVHGIRHLMVEPDVGTIETALVSDWFNRLDRSLVGHPTPPDPGIESLQVPYYADVLHDDLSVGHGWMPAGSQWSCLGPATGSMLSSLAAQWRSQDQSLPGDDRELLSAKLGIDDLEQVDRMAHRYLRELAVYLSDPAVRHEARTRIRERLESFRPNVVLGHDLGALVAHDCLSTGPTPPSPDSDAWEDAPGRVPLLITVSAPWGSTWVLDRYGVSGRPLERPPGVTRWVDLYATGDVFAVNRPVKARIRHDQWEQVALDDVGLVRHDLDERPYLEHSRLGGLLLDCMSPDRKLDVDQVAARAAVASTRGPMMAPDRAPEPAENLSWEDQISFRDLAAKIFNRSHLDRFLRDIGMFERDRPDPSRDLISAWEDALRVLREGADLEHGRRGHHGQKALLARSYDERPMNTDLKALAVEYSVTGPAS